MPNTTPTEHIEQVNFVNWLEFHHKEIKFFAVPNGEKRSISVGKRLKAEGVRPGVPDLWFPGIFLVIEMKRQKGGRVSDEQKEWIDYLDKSGYVVKVCKGCEEAKKVFLDRLKQIKIMQGKCKS